MNAFRPDSLKSNDSLFHENEMDALKQELEYEKNNRFVVKFIVSADERLPFVLCSGTTLVREMTNWKRPS